MRSWQKAFLINRMINCKTLILFPMQIKAHFSHPRAKEPSVFWGQSELDSNFYSYPWDLSDNDQILLTFLRLSQYQSAIKWRDYLSHRLAVKTKKIWYSRNGIYYLLHGKDITAIIIIKHWTLC